MSCLKSPNTVKPRHLFLFSDLLLIAKPRSGGMFKMKESVRVSEVWLSSCPESETGFLLGWPAPAKTVLVTFCTQAARDCWWRELQNALESQLRFEPPTTNIKVVYRDPLSGTECVSIFPTQFFHCINLRLLVENVGHRSRNGHPRHRAIGVGRNR